MKKYDTLITLKISRTLKNKLEKEAKEKDITLSELLRLRANNVLRYNDEDIPSISLKGDQYLAFKRCPRCNGIFHPKYTTQLMCCNACACKDACNCGAKERQRLLII